MTVYFRAWHLIAVHCELSRDLGCLPLCAINICEKEIIIDIPYFRAIVTPYQKLKRE
jgi:hypothetical protein